MSTWPKNADPESGCSGTLWDGDYEKQHYLVTTPDGERVVCWPNAGRMHANDGSGRDWWPKDGVGVLPISIEDALRLLREKRGGQ
jgi:hypothetical protein